MARPSKPIEVIKSEKKSHRTKAEIKQRESAEKSVLTGKRLVESPRVRNNIDAHKEFTNIKKMFEAIDKNDNIYGAVINRYCIITAEVIEMELHRDEVYSMMQDMKSQFEELIHDEVTNIDTRVEYSIEFSRQINKLSSTYIAIDKQIQAKRSMLLAIEKENIMTVQAALRSIPKQNNEEESQLMKVLSGGV